MKYYLIRYNDGLFVYKEYENSIERIKTFRPSDDDFFNIYCIRGTVENYAEMEFILFESENLDEIVERAALEAL